MPISRRLRSPLLTQRGESKSVGHSVTVGSVTTVAHEERDVIAAAGASPAAAASNDCSTAGNSGSVVVQRMSTRILDGSTV